MKEQLTVTVKQIMLLVLKVMAIEQQMMMLLWMTVVLVVQLYKEKKVHTNTNKYNKYSTNQ
jgi:hypothetical protein